MTPRHLALAAGSLALGPLLVAGVMEIVQRAIDASKVRVKIRF